jgi:hypothetical protein
MLRSIIKWVELNLGWIFINGRKVDWWEQKLRNKYPEEYNK